MIDHAVRVALLDLAEFGSIMVTVKELVPQIVAACDLPVEAKDVGDHVIITLVGGEPL